MAANDLKKAQVAAQNAEKYAPNDAGSHMRLGFISYLAGDKAAALDEFAKAKSLDAANFEKRWKSNVDSLRFKPMLEDQGFQQKLFPTGVPK